MYSSVQLFTIHSLTPIHPGSGSNLSYVDLPIQRERHTSFPLISGSSLKGVIRDLARRTWDDNEIVEEFFGSEETGEKASNVAFTDAKILFYPVRSVRGIFALVTCPYVLNRFVNELKSISNEDIKIGNIEVSDDKAKYVTGSILLVEQNQIGLEEFVFNGEEINQSELNNIIELANLDLNLQKRIAIVSDSVFTDLVNYAVDIRTRISIDSTKGVAKDGALFVVEMVPSEAIFYSFVLCKEADKGGEISGLLNDKIIQVGGDETIGSGIVKLIFSQKQT